MPTTDAKRVVLVTGAAGGIGRATALRFARSGCSLMLVDLDHDGLELVAEGLCRAEGSQVRTARCDVAIEAEVGQVVDATIAAYGRLDVVVNNAGTMRFQAIEEMDASSLDRVLGTNLVGPFWFLKHAFLRCVPGSSVVNVSSVHAVRTSSGVSSYAAAKAGLLALTRAASIEGKAKGIRVNAVVVGAIDTPMLHGNPNVISGVERIDPAMMGQPDDVAAAIEFLASPEARFVTGATLQVDGGRLAAL